MTDLIATEAVVDRDVPVGAATGVWSVTLYAEHTEIVDGFVLPTQDRAAHPLGEATSALQERGYVVTHWRNEKDDQWVATLARTAPAAPSA